MTLLLNDLHTLCHTRLEKLFQTYLVQSHCTSSDLKKSIIYTVNNGGKRLRPIIIYLAHPLFDTPLEKLDAAACAIEFIHTYSLIHDDLPAMDNADLRRGVPTCHKA